jgi:hypothetical protein
MSELCEEYKPHRAPIGTNSFEEDVGFPPKISFHAYWSGHISLDTIDYGRMCHGGLEFSPPAAAEAGE